MHGYSFSLCNIHSRLLGCDYESSVPAEMGLLFALWQPHPRFDSPQGQGLKSLEDTVATCGSVWKADRPAEDNRWELWTQHWKKQTLTLSIEKWVKDFIHIRKS